MTTEIKMSPIGIIESPFRTRADLNIPPFKPEAPYHNQAVIGTIRLYDEFWEGAVDIKPGSYGMLVFYFDRSESWSLKTSSPRHKGPVGVFSTRSPNRPNSIGVSVVRFVSIDQGTLTFQGVDMLDGTPLLDIKPYSGENLPS